MTRRTDSNQAEIVAALRQAGASVFSLHAVGRGVPDLLVGFRGNNYLLEVKSEKGKLTEDQEKWINNWRGHVAIVRSVGEALKSIGAT